jgi:hypothetical protein
MTGSEKQAEYDGTRAARPTMGRRKAGLRFTEAQLQWAGGVGYRFTIIFLDLVVRGGYSRGSSLKIGAGFAKAPAVSEPMPRLVGRSYAAKRPLV